VEDELPGELIGDFTDVLAHTFLTKEKLGYLLRTKLNQYQHIVATAPSGDMQDIAYYLTQTAEAEGWIHDLIQAVHQKYPKGPGVAVFYQKYQKWLQKSKPRNLPHKASDASPPLTTPHTLKPSGKTTLRPQQQPAFASDDVQLASPGDMLPSVPLSPHQLPSKSHQVAFSFLYFRRRKHYHSPLRGIRVFFSRYTLKGNEIASLLPFLSNRSSETTVS